MSSSDQAIASSSEVQDRENEVVIFSEAPASPVQEEDSDSDTEVEYSLNEEEVEAVIPLSLSQPNRGPSLLNQLREATRGNEGEEGGEGGEGEQDGANAADHIPVQDSMNIAESFEVVSSTPDANPPMTPRDIFIGRSYFFFTPAQINSFFVTALHLVSLIESGDFRNSFLILYLMNEAIPSYIM